MAATYLFSTPSYCCLRNLSGIGATKQASSVAANCQSLLTEVGRWRHYLFVDRKQRLERIRGNDDIATNWRK